MAIQGGNTENPLRETLFACKVMLKFVLIFGFMANILVLATPLYSMQVLDRVISSGNTNTLLMLSIIIATAIGLLALVQAARSFAMIKMGAWIEHKLADKVFENSISAAMTNKNIAGSVQMRDLQTIKTYLTSPQIISMMDLPWAVIFIVVLFILNVYFGVIALLGSIFLLGMSVVSDRLTSPLLNSNNDNFIKSMSKIEQTTKNAEVVNAMGLLPNILKKWHKLNKKVQNTQSLATKRQSVLTEFTTFFRTVIQISVTGIGAVLVIQNEITAGVIIASSSLVGRALAPFQVAISSWKGFIKFKKSFSRLNKMFEHYVPSAGQMELPAPKGHLKIDGLYYVPPGGKKHTLRGIAFDLPAGETLVIMGPSGSGKTTLVRLLVNAIQPSSGTIRIDGAKLSDWPKAQLGEHVGYLPQDVELFSGTVKENIARMLENSDSDEVLRAAQLAGVHELILHLPKGYDTEIGPSGSALSGGQRQRIGLARALYGKPKVLFLDEPNSNLDADGEEALSLALEVAKEEQITTIIVSHRTNVVNLANKIMILKDGAVATYGSQKEVLEKMRKLRSVGNSG